jgi:hypothetical protein
LLTGSSFCLDGEYALPDMLIGIAQAGMMQYVIQPVLAADG